MSDARPRIDQVNIVVDDVEAATAFYRRIGLEVPDTLPEWQGQHRTIESPDGLDADLDSADFAEQWGGITGGVVVGVRMPTREAVDAAHADLVAAGHPSVRAPYDAFWGARYALVLDPSGNAVGLMSPIDPERRAPTPTPPS